MGGGWEPSSLTTLGWGASMDFLGAPVWEPWPYFYWHASSTRHPALLSWDNSK